MFNPTSSSGRYESIDLEDQEESREQPTFANCIRPRSVFAVAATSKKPERVERGEFSQRLPEHVTTGEEFSLLVKERPDDVISILRNRAVTKVGEFYSNKPELLKAFQKETKMVTNDFNDVHILNSEYTWEGILRNVGHVDLAHDGWHETMKLTAYCVNIKHAAAVLEDGIMRPLLLKAETGEADDAVWGFPSVRAVIDFKWTHWARKYLIAEFLLYLGWLLCFAGFMIIYIEKNLDKEFRRHMDGGDKTLALLAYALDAGSLLFMCPFLVIEYNAIKHYGCKWLCTWNVLHSLAFVLQFLVSALHFFDIGFASKYYVSLLAVHCTILFIKLQYFARVMNPKATYVETLKTLIYNVRYFLLFIVLSVISAALSFTVLYKWEIANCEDDEEFRERFEGFDSLPKAVVTTYSILIGHFESSYVFHTENRLMKGTFFLFFQLFLSIAFLNLLIAVMTESYKTVMTKQNIIYYRCKAQIIDELELFLPKLFYPEFKSYVHFIVCEKRNKLPEEENTPASQEALKNFENGVKTELQALRHIVERLERKVDRNLPNND